jgi:cytoskeletal protein CcmA (bactofilin family)
MTELSTTTQTSANGGPEAKTVEVMPTTLSKEDSLTGSLLIAGDGQILGTYKGDIGCGGELYVGRDAEVNAAVVSVNMTISGFVRGNVTVSGRLKILSTGRLEGDARVASLIVQEGGVHHGVIRVHPEGLPAEDEEEPELVKSSAGNGSATNGTPIERVKKLWGEFF